MDATATGLGSAVEGDLAGRVARSIASRDVEALRGLLAEQVEFRALTPGRFWEADDRESAIDIVFGSWFEPSDVITEVIASDTEQMADRVSLQYRLRGHNADGDFLVEQRAYAQQTNGTINWLRIICSGFRPTASS